MSMIIGRGDPQITGRYACYIDVDKVATVICTYLPGTGWLTNLKEPPCGKIVGWIGPLPLMPSTAAMLPVEEDEFANFQPSLEFDL